MRGIFITFEGVDGAGKSSQIDAAVAFLEGAGHRVVRSREPGGTTLGERLRELLLHESMGEVTELMLMFAARRHHLVERIIPALIEGEWVVCDRFTDSSYAYQVGGRGVERGRFDAIAKASGCTVDPDLTFLFDLSPDAAAERRGSRTGDDRFERESREFFTRVRNAYLQRAAESGGRIKVIDATLPAEEIRAQIESHLEEEIRRSRPIRKTA